jgi:hypothetical protein
MQHSSVSLRKLGPRPSSMELQFRSERANEKEFLEVDGCNL